MCIVPTASAIQLSIFFTPFCRFVLKNEHFFNL
nr:MAG TPA: hypothetical protein [Caudoviricetes sp.]